MFDQFIIKRRKTMWVTCFLGMMILILAKKKNSLGIINKNFRAETEPAKKKTYIIQKTPWRNRAVLIDTSTCSLTAMSSIFRAFSFVHLVLCWSSPLTFSWIVTFATCLRSCLPACLLLGVSTFSQEYLQVGISPRLRPGSWALYVHLQVE